MGRYINRIGFVFHIASIQRHFILSVIRSMSIPLRSKKKFNVPLPGTQTRIHRDQNNSLCIVNTFLRFMFLISSSSEYTGKKLFFRET